nr:MAG TPA: hypothetical protein [Caudoviricetes sp.]
MFFSVFILHTVLQVYTLIYIGISPLFDGKIIYSISKKEEKHAFLFVQR